MSSGKDVIFWDFDGVIMNSNAVRDEGFKLTLAEFPDNQVESLMDFHRKNGGLSRYVKFRYFFETIRGEELTESDLKKWTTKFGAVMRKSLTNKDLLIAEIIDFIKENQSFYTMYVVSGSDQEELRFLCGELGIAHLFRGIYGSPTAKVDLVEHLLASNNLTKEKCFLVGDSINDKEAAEANGIRFYAYNNKSLVQYPQFKIKFLNE